MLSLRGQISTTSSDAARDHQEGYRKIGAGACGAVFAIDAQPAAFKLAKADQESLWNDFCMHKLIAENIRKWESSKWAYADVKVPECYYFVPKDDHLYFDKNPSLTEAAKDTCNLQTSILVSERIQRELAVLSFGLMEGQRCSSW